MPDRIWVRSFVTWGACHLIRMPEDTRTLCGRAIPVKERNKLRHVPVEESACVKCLQNEAAAEKRRAKREAASIALVVTDAIPNGSGSKVCQDCDASTQHPKTATEDRSAPKITPEAK